MNDFTTSDSADWASAVCVADRLMRPRDKGSESDPRVEVQLATENVFLAQGPTEYFSQAMPSFVPLPPDDDSLKPIDVLYGRYLSDNRRIEIFVRRIEQDAALFDCSPTELLKIVRIHEIAHAVCHVGISIRDVERHLSNYGAVTQPI